MIKYTNKEAAMFVIVGSIGFIVNMLVLVSLYKGVHFSLLTAQIIAAEIAILCNFALHNRLTYSGARKDSTKKRLARYHISSATGSIITIAILMLLTQVFMQNYIVSLVVGAAAAMTWNFVINRIVIWKHSHNDTSEGLAPLTP